MDAIRKGGRTGEAWLFGRAACAAASVAFPTSAKPGKHCASKAPAIRRYGYVETPSAASCCITMTCDRRQRGCKSHIGGAWLAVETSPHIDGLGLEAAPGSPIGCDSPASWRWAESARSWGWRAT